MTYKELIIEARHRLQDIRAKNGSIITTSDVTENGIRWTFERLNSICKGAVAEMLRTLFALHLDKAIDTSVQYRQYQGTLSLSSGYMILSLTDDPEYLRIISIQDINDASKIYAWKDQEDFFSSRYFNQTYDLDNDTAIDELDYIFTTIYDESSNKKQTIALPLSSTVQQVQTIVRVSFNPILDVSSSVQLPFVDSDDILLDYIEKNALQISHDPQGVQLTAGIIQTKLKEKAIELQANN